MYSESHHIPCPHLENIMATAVAELSFAEEVIARAEESDFTKRELASLKRVLAKKSDGDILEAVRRLSNIGSAVDADAFVGLLYSLTDTQLIDFERTLKVIDGWD